MFGKRKLNATPENRICSLCEYSVCKDDRIFCNEKEVESSHCCKNFLFDPQKKKVKRLSVRSRTDEIEFLPLD